VEKMEYELFFRLLGNVLPCGKCQEHYLAYLQSHPKQFENAFKNKKSLFKWMLEFHNYVNLQSKKPLQNIKQIYTQYF